MHDYLGAPQPSQRKRTNPLVCSMSGVYRKPYLLELLLKSPLANDERVALNDAMILACRAYSGRMKFCVLGIPHRSLSPAQFTSRPSRGTVEMLILALASFTCRL